MPRSTKSPKNGNRHTTSTKAEWKYPEFQKALVLWIVRWMFNDPQNEKQWDLLLAHCFTDEETVRLLIKRLFSSETAVASLIGILPSNFDLWVMGNQIPRYDSCVKIAQGLGVPLQEVLLVAGHKDRMNHTSTFDEIIQALQAIQQDAFTDKFTKEKRDETICALEQAKTPEFQEHFAIPWMTFINASLEQAADLVAKGRAIHALVMSAYESERDPE